MANETSTTTRTVPDVQSGVPATQVSLSRVGVTGVEKVIRVRDNGDDNLFYAEMECFVDLEPRQAGVHMSRFEEIVNEAIDSVIQTESLRAEELVYSGIPGLPSREEVAREAAKPQKDKAGLEIACLRGLTATLKVGT